jgi:predicted DCC family thiol-disulfide oxidoreductase YuxK
MKTVKPLPALIVWYNTKCPVCNAGIDWQRNRLVRAARAGAIEFRDINIEPDALQHFGADCAIAVWLRTPGDAWLGRLLGLPGIRHIARAGYDVFANLLFAWNRWKGHW